MDTHHRAGERPKASARVGRRPLPAGTSSSGCPSPGAGLGLLPLLGLVRDPVRVGPRPCARPPRRGSVSGLASPRATAHSARPQHAVHLLLVQRKRPGGAHPGPGCGRRAGRPVRPGALAPPSRPSRSAWVRTPQAMSKPTPPAEMMPRPWDRRPPPADGKAVAPVGVGMARDLAHDARQLGHPRSCSATASSMPPRPGRRWRTGPRARAWPRCAAAPRVVRDFFRVGKVHAVFLSCSSAGRSKTARARREKKSRPTRIRQTRGFGFFEATQPSRDFHRPATRPPRTGQPCGRPGAGPRPVRPRWRP